METVNIKNLMDKLLVLDDNIRNVSIIDVKQNTLMTCMKKNKISLKNRKEQDDFAMEIKKLKYGQDAFTSPLGEMRFFQINVEKNL